MIFYAHDTPITIIIILLNIITELFNIGFTVVSVTSDMGSTIIGLWKSINLSFTNGTFKHPIIPDRMIHVFADAPHFLKLIRNNFLLKTQNSGINI